jgi:hypothetical protein
MIGERFSPNVGDPTITLSAQFSALLTPLKSEGLTYESLNDYQNIEIVAASPYSSHRVLKATKISTQETWYLTLRSTEFSAQLDKAISEVFRKYIPETPETTLVREGEDYYTASRAVENIVFSVEPHSPHFAIYNFGSINILTHFVAESDMNICNVLISEEDYLKFVGRKIDHEECLDEKVLQESNVNLEGILGNHWDFPPAVINHFNYQREQFATLDSLCKTPFSEISGIIKKYVRAGDIDTKLKLLQKRHEGYQGVNTQRLMKA